MVCSPSRFFVCAFVFAFASASLTARAGDTVSLKLKAGPAADAYVEHEDDVSQEIVGPDGKPMTIKVRNIYGMMQKQSANGDSVEVASTLDRLYGYTQFSEAIKSLYDTDDPDYEEASPLHKDTFVAILNMPLKWTVDAKGNATAVDGAEAIRNKLIEFGEANYVAKSMADDGLTDAQVKAIFAEVPFVLFANRDVKVGDTWEAKRTNEYPQVGRVHVTYECKLDGIEKSGAVVSYTGTITKDADEKPAKDKRLGKIDAAFTGTARFDSAKGCFVEITSLTKATTEVPPWWTKEPTAPLMKIKSESKYTYSVVSSSDRKKQKAGITERVAAAKTKRDAEEAAAMAGPVDPTTPENTPEAWLEWGGPNRDFKSTATGLANRWPKEGPAKLWERPLGDGYSAVLSDGDTLYTTYSVREKGDALKGDEIIVALDAKTGKTRWEHKYAVPWTKDLQMEFGPGPHSTPIVVGDKLYSVGSTAKLVCLDKKNGKPIWSKDLQAEFKADLLMRGYGSSPMAYKGNIVLPVSKEKGQSIMAFDQATGSVSWKGGEFEPGYASLLIINMDGADQIVAFTGKSVDGLDPTNGKSLWTIAHPTQWSANISTPVWGAEDNHLFISSAYGMGSRGVKLEKAGSQIAAKEVWFNPKLKIQHADAVRIGEWVYGSSGDFGPGFLACVNAKTGEFGWRQRGIAKANVVHADGKLIVLDEDGILFLVKADSAKYQLLAKSPVLFKKTAWTVPTLVGRTLYVRDREKIVALDLGEKKSNS
ncbi:MAG: DUF6263 family protein [Planctomycetota bacterium]